MAVNILPVALPEPPRITGNVQHDFQALLEYVWAAYKAQVIEGGFVQAGDFAAQMQAQFPRLYNLAALAGVVADTIPYFTAELTWEKTDFTAFARTILDDANSDAVLVTLGIYNFVNDPELLALGALTSAADKLPYFTGIGSAATTDLTAFIRTLLDDPDLATAQATLGIGPATDIPLADLEDIDDERLVGRSAGSAGPPHEITVGPGLTLAGGELDAVTQGSWIPMVDGAEPPTFLTDGAGQLLLVAYSP